LPRVRFIPLHSHREGMVVVELPMWAESSGVPGLAVAGQEKTMSRDER
jgi:hypothetical protein